MQKAKQLGTRLNAFKASWKTILTVLHPLHELIPFVYARTYLINCPQR